MAAGEGGGGQEGRRGEGLKKFLVLSAKDFFLVPSFFGHTFLELYCIFDTKSDFCWRYVFLVKRYCDDYILTITEANAKDLKRQ
jgi:hypothetical protein